MGVEVLSKEAKRRVRTYAQAMFDNAVDSVRVKWKIKPEDWNPTIDIRWSGNSSFGMRDGIIVVFCPSDIVSGDRFVCPEYPHIAQDPEIGSFYSKSWRPVVQALIAHELAHSLTIYLNPATAVNLPPSDKNYDGNHGKKWQEAYRWILKFGFTPGKRTKAPRISI